MEHNLCDICGRPATHFFDVVHCDAVGGSTSSVSIQLCALHAAAHEQTTAQETLDSMLRSWRRLAAFAQLTDVVEIVFDARRGGCRSISR
jgi:hypothetical protein